VNHQALGLFIARTKDLDTKILGPDVVAMRIATVTKPTRPEAAGERPQPPYEVSIT
jgi:hypothetical protein